MDNNRHILVVNDQSNLRSILLDFTMSPMPHDTPALPVEQMEDEIVNQSYSKQTYIVDKASKLNEACTLIIKSLNDENPYSVIFIDIKSPLGLREFEEMFSLSPNTQFVICTTSEIITSQEFIGRIGQLNNLLILKKPFDKIELLQLALTLNNKFNYERKLIYANHYLDQIFLSMKSVLIFTTPSGKITHWNSASEIFTGISKNSALTKIIWDILPDLKILKNNFNEVIESNSTFNLKHFEIEFNNEIKYIDIVINPLNVKKGAIDEVAIKIDDVTMSVKKDNLLRQSQKMDSIGNLVAGLAHDFKNVIGGIDGATSLMKYCLEMENDISVLKDDMSQSVHIIKESAIRGMDMIGQLLTLSRKEELPLSPVNLNDLIENVIKIGKNSFGQGIRLQVNYFITDAMILAYPTQMEQVILNICLNAFDAMKTLGNDGIISGTLSISVSAMELSRDITTSIPQLSAGEYWLLTISDTGVGMDKGTASKIFDPFFTTKEKGKGTGLGLAMAYNIITQHKGFIEVSSQKNIGSTFSIFLPKLVEHWAP